MDINVCANSGGANTPGERPEYGSSGEEEVARFHTLFIGLAESIFGLPFSRFVRSI